MKLKKKLIHLVGGARPNFIKIAPLYKLLEKHKDFEVKFINTGQHNDKNLSSEIIKDLELCLPDYNLNVGLGSPNYHISEIIKKYDILLTKNKPDLVMVFGDVSSTLAIAIATKKKEIKLAHVEAGLRCYDQNLPEEMNRKLTDSISDYLFTPTKIENKNLLKENISKNIFFVGNIMIDSLVTFMKKKKKQRITMRKFDGILTLHRPENVDSKANLLKIIKKVVKVTKGYRILFPIHPRTKKNLENFNLYDFLKDCDNIQVSEPLIYSDFLLQTSNVKFVITDSGGIQEETSFLGVDCFTLRKNTERPITISSGSNKLINLKDLNKRLLLPKKRKKNFIEKWDGNTSKRIIKVLEKILIKKGQKSFQRY